MKKGVAKTTLIPDNLDTALAAFDSPEFLDAARTWYLIIADMLDGIIAAPGTHITWGLNRARNSLLITVTDEADAKLYASGTIQADLMTDAVLKLADEKVVATLT